MHRSDKKTILKLWPRPVHVYCMYITNEVSYVHAEGTCTFHWPKSKGFGANKDLTRCLWSSWSDLGALEGRPGRSDQGYFLGPLGKGLKALACDYLRKFRKRNFQKFFGTFCYFRTKAPNGCFCPKIAEGSKKFLGQINCGKFILVEKLLTFGQVVGRISRPTFFGRQLDRRSKVFRSLVKLFVWPKIWQR